MLNPGAWNWGNFTSFFWVSFSNQPLAAWTQFDDLHHSLTFAKAGICFLCIIYTYFRVPKPQGRSFAELDLLFERGVSARKFATTNVDVFDETVDGVTNTYDEKEDVTLSHSEKVVGS
jgi:SP family general alpha glucoside:H+ symporter-like MFS transporter